MTKWREHCKCMMSDYYLMCIKSLCSAKQKEYNIKWSLEDAKEIPRKTQGWMTWNPYETTNKQTLLSSYKRKNHLYMISFSVSHVCLKIRATPLLHFSLIWIEHQICFYNNFTSNHERSDDWGINYGNWISWEWVLNLASTKESSNQPWNIVTKHESSRS